MYMQSNNLHLLGLKAECEILQAIENNGGKISRNKLHEVTDRTYKTLDNIIKKLEEHNDIIFLGDKSGKRKKNKKWKMAEITQKGEGKLDR